LALYDIAIQSKHVLVTESVFSHFNLHFISTHVLPQKIFYFGAQAKGISCFGREVRQKLRVLEYL